MRNQEGFFPPISRATIADRSPRLPSRMHGGSARLAQSVLVRGHFKGKTVWEGVVHVLNLTKHPAATRAYARFSPIEGSGNRRFFAVLHQPPVDSPELRCGRRCRGAQEGLKWVGKCIRPSLEEFPDNRSGVDYRMKRACRFGPGAFRLKLRQFAVPASSVQRLFGARSAARRHDRPQRGAKTQPTDDLQ